MVRFPPLAPLLATALSLAALAAPAQSSTYRYSFDVTASDIGFVELSKVSSLLEDLPVTLEERNAIIDEFHPLGSLRGKTGPVVFDLHLPSGLPTDPNEEIPVTKPLKCVSGFLCLADWVGTLSISGLGNLSGLTPEGNPFSLSETSIVYDFNGKDGRTISEKSHFLNLSGAQARFDLANFSRTELIPVPLPAGIFLLGGGLVLFAIGGRRQRRRTQG